MEEVKKTWLDTSGPNDIKKIADHYGIFKDLYGDAYFNPRVHLDVNYSIDNDGSIVKVFRGNLLKPIEASKPPKVIYNSEPDTFWTLLLTCPDGNLVEENSEYCHWFM